MKRATTSEHVETQAHDAPEDSYSVMAGRWLGSESGQKALNDATGLISPFGMSEQKWFRDPELFHYPLN